MKVFRCSNGENLVVADRIKNNGKAWKRCKWIYYAIWWVPGLVALIMALMKMDAGDIFIVFATLLLGTIIFNMLFKAALRMPMGDLIAYTDLILAFDENNLSQTGIAREDMYDAIQGRAVRVEIPYANITKLVWNPEMEHIVIHGPNVYLKKGLVGYKWEFKRIGHFATKNTFRLSRMYPDFGEIVALLEEKSGKKVEGYVPGEFTVDEKPGYMSSLYGAPVAGGEKTLLHQVGTMATDYYLQPPSVVLNRMLVPLMSRWDEQLGCPVCGENTFIKNVDNEFGICINCGCRRIIECTTDENTVNLENICNSISEKIAGLEKRPLFIAIDGRCASGKTTLAGWLRGALEEELLQLDMSKQPVRCNVIHMDHFFLQPHQRTSERLQEPGGNVDYERVLEEVLIPLSKGEKAVYRIYDCHKQDFGDEIVLQPAGITIIEGSYACHPVLRSYYDLKVFLTVEPEEQLRRIELRNGMDAVDVFREKWIPLEEAYFTRLKVAEESDIVINVSLNFVEEPNEKTQ